MFSPLSMINDGLIEIVAVNEKLSKVDVMKLG